MTTFRDVFVVSFPSACIAMCIVMCIAIMLDMGRKMLYLCNVFRKDTENRTIIL